MAKEEYDGLEPQILRDGCLDALRVWDRDGQQVLLDGHNRLKICNKHNLPYDTSTIEIDSIDEAVIWIVDNQKGRRNVATKEQQDYISGKRYEVEKNLRGRPRITNSNESNTQSPDNLNISLGRTVHKRAMDEGVSHDTITQNARFAKGVDAIREVSPELADKILKPEKDAPKLTKRTVAAIPKLKEAEPEKFKETVAEIKEALETKDKQVVEMVVRDHIKPDEPTHEEKMIAKKHHLKPEHVRYANEHNIPYENLRTVEQIDRINSRKKSACSTIWDGFYRCDCGIQFEIFGAIHAPVCCPHCGKSENLKRHTGE